MTDEKLTVEAERMKTSHQVDTVVEDVGVSFPVDTTRTDDQKRDKAV
jgi:hypothetical protein